MSLLSTVQKLIINLDSEIVVQEKRESERVIDEEAEREDAKAASGGACSDSSYYSNHSGSPYFKEVEAQERITEPNLPKREEAKNKLLELYPELKAYQPELQQSHEQLQQAQEQLQTTYDLCEWYHPLTKIKLKGRLGNSKTKTLQASVQIINAKRYLKTIETLKD